MPTDSPNLSSTADALDPASTRRLKITVAYLGTPFSGWQAQPDKNAVQDHLEAAARRILGHPIRIHGSGRTDAGVHAHAQVAHFTFPAASTSLADQNWIAAFNGNLPQEIRVLSAETVSADFHARFSATGKTYQYHIYNHPVADPFLLGRAWHIPNPIPLPSLQSAVGLLTGTHNFQAFAANRGPSKTSSHKILSQESFIRTIYSAEILPPTSTSPCIIFQISGNGFLYRMVRLLTATLVRVAQNRMPHTEFQFLLSGNSPKKSHFCAPSDGLYLHQVQYPHM